MTAQEYLLSEQASLHRFLGTAADAIERASLTSRLEEIQDELNAIGPPAPQPAKAILTFRGKPVVGHLGVSAEFGTEATRLFSDAVTKAVASRRGALARTGPIPQKDEGDLLITGTATGSFGFELVEHHPPAPGSDVESPVAAAFGSLRTLFESTQETDDVLADATEQLSPRVIEATRKFLTHLKDHDAVCALEAGGKAFRFPNVATVEASLQRVSTENLQKERVTLKGEFEGSPADGPPLRVPPGR